MALLDIYSYVYTQSSATHFQNLTFSEEIYHTFSENTFWLSQRNCNGSEFQKGRINLQSELGRYIHSRMVTKDLSFQSQSIANRNNLDKIRLLPRKLTYPPLNIDSWKMKFPKLKWSIFRWHSFIFWWKFRVFTSLGTSWNSCCHSTVLGVTSQLGSFTPSTWSSKGFTRKPRNKKLVTSAVKTKW